VLGARQFGGDRGGEARVAGEAEQVINPIQLAPAHQPLAGKAQIAAQQETLPSGLVNSSSPSFAPSLGRFQATIA
jgi:hypothetical protein